MGAAGASPHTEQEQELCSLSLFASRALLMALSLSRGTLELSTSDERTCLTYLLLNSVVAQ